MKVDELKICGLPAVRARFEENPASILRLFFDASTARQLGSVCRGLAAARKVYRCVEPAELEKIAGSLHHGGVVAVVVAPAQRTVTGAEVGRWAKQGEAVLVLDRIGNAHNLGAIARTAAFFGVPHLVLASDAAAARPGEAAYRVAEGGFEFLDVWSTPAVAACLRLLAAAGFDVVGAATRGGAPPRRAGPGAGSAPVRAWALVLGNEEHGLEPKAAAACTRLVTIPGGGRIESLNVSVAAAILLAQLVDQQPPRRPVPPVRHGG